MTLRDIVVQLVCFHGRKEFPEKHEMVRSESETDRDHSASSPDFAARATRELPM